MIPAKEFEGELWIKAADFHKQKKEWVGLTDMEIDLMAFNDCAEDWNDPIFKECWVEGYITASRSTEAKLKEKNSL